MPTTEQPRTPTGRHVLEEWEDEGGPDHEMARAILAIESEAASLDVERLAKVLDRFFNLELGLGSLDDHLGAAKAIAAEYTRSSEHGSAAR